MNYYFYALLFTVTSPGTGEKGEQEEGDKKDFIGHRQHFTHTGGRER